MRYDHDNVMPGAKCIDMASGDEIWPALSVDTDKCEVKVARFPMRVAEDGESIDAYAVTFSAISTGFDPHTGLPNEFKCYGRQG